MCSRKTTFPFFIVILLFFVAEINLVQANRWSNSNAENSALSCSTKERNSFLSFKGLKDTSNCLSSWVDEDCCNWFCVGCSNQTGYVTKLDLHSRYFSSSLEESNKKSCKQLNLGGKLSPLLDLKYLAYLNLSGNAFQGIPIPSFVGSLTNLRYLDLSDSSFGGMIPPNIGNLSKLRYLDLQAISYPRELWASDLHWLPNLSSLAYLNLGGVNLNKNYEDWLQAINMLPSLRELHLSKCNLGNSLQSLRHLNLTSLLVFYLSFNHFNSSSILQWLFNITTLFNLNLSWSNLGGPIPKVIKGCLCNLQTFDLSTMCSARLEAC